MLRNILFLHFFLIVNLATLLCFWFLSDDNMQDFLTEKVFAKRIRIIMWEVTNKMELFLYLISNQYFICGIFILRSVEVVIVFYKILENNRSEINFSFKWIILNFCKELSKSSTMTIFEDNLLHHEYIWIQLIFDI